MIGLPKSSRATPAARSRARAPAMLRPWVTVRDLSSGIQRRLYGGGGVGGRRWRPVDQRLTRVTQDPLRELLVVDRPCQEQRADERRQRHHRVRGWTLRTGRPQQLVEARQVPLDLAGVRGSE